MYDDIRKVIEYIIKLESLEIIRNRNKFFSLLSDLAPELNEERKILGRSLTDESMKLIYTAMKSPTNNFSSQIKMVSSYLINELGLNEKWAKFTLECFFEKDFLKFEELESLDLCQFETDSFEDFLPQKRTYEVSFNIDKKNFKFNEFLSLESTELFELSKNIDVMQRAVDACSAKIVFGDSGITVLADCIDDVNRLKNIIDTFLYGPEVGSIFRGVITRFDEENTYVELVPGIEGEVSLEELDVGDCFNPQDVVNIGDEVIVKVLSVVSKNKIYLSRKQAQIEIEGLIPIENKKNNENTIEKIEHLSQNGNVCAQYIIGYCYRWGKCINKDEKKSKELMRSAAARGFIPAQYYYAHIILESFEEESFLDQIEAKRMLNLALENEDIDSVYLYGCFKLEGHTKNITIEKNIDSAIECFEKIAVSSLNDKTQNIINMYQEAVEMCEGIEELYKFMKSIRDSYVERVNNGHPHAQHHLGRLLLDKRFGSAENARGISLLEKSVKKGDFLAAYELGWYYENKSRFYTEMDKSRDWYQIGEKLAKESGNPEYDVKWFKSYKTKENL